MRTTHRRLVALGLGVAATAVGPIAPVDAAPPDESGVVTRQAYPDGRVYAEDGIIVVTGPPFELGCAGDGFAEPVFSTVHRPDGTEIAHYTVVDRVAVFEGADPFALIDAACGALADGDPATEPPAPIAVGEGRVRHREQVSPDGVLDGRNSVTAQVTTTAGARVHVNTFASFTESSDGLELHQLRVNYRG